jgi:hypothetical protein
MGKHLPSSFFLLVLAALVSYQVSNAQNAPSQVRVGVILDLTSPVGHRLRTGIQMAVEDYYAAHPGSATRVELHFRDSASDVLRAASAGTLNRRPIHPSTIQKLSRTLQSAVCY